MVSLPIYLDNHATTPTDPRVVEAMLPYFSECFGNAASLNHPFGRAARHAVEESRASIASAIGSSEPSEIVFTSGATESDNLAVIGSARALRDRGESIVTVQTEHKAVLDSCRHLEAEGFRATYLPARADGLVDLDALRGAITDSTILVSVMHANNEIGAIQDIAAIGRLCRERGVLFHTDAAQSLGKVPLDVRETPVDLISFTAHKMYGPKGVAGLYVRRGAVRPAIQMHGGGHEFGLRSGTLNVAGIVGLAAALKLCLADREAENLRIGALRDRLQQALTTAIPEALLNGHPVQRLPGNLNLSLPRAAHERLASLLQDVALSAGSACSSGSSAGSHVLKAIGRTDAQASSAIRIGVGRFNTDEEIDYFARRVVEATCGSAI